MVSSPSVLTILQLYFTLTYFFILFVLLIYLFAKKKKLRQFPLHKKFNLRNKGVYILDLCTSF